MARVSIKEAKVDRIIPGWGFVAVSSFTKRDGSEGREYFTIWTKDPVQEGQVFDISGLLSVKIEEWNDKVTGELQQRAAVAVNNPILKPSEDFSKPVPQTTLEDAFGTVKAIPSDSEAPF